MGGLSADNKRQSTEQCTRDMCHLHYSLRGQVNSEYGLKWPQ